MSRLSHRKHERGTRRGPRTKEMSNEIKAYIYSTFYNVGFMFCTGAIAQTFLLQIGFSAQQVYLYSSLAQIAQTLMMVLMIFLSPRIKHVKRVISVSYLSLVLIGVILFIGALFPSAVNNAYVIIFFIATVICNLGAGIYMVLAYCIPYYTIDMKNYGRFISLQMVFLGAASFLLSSLHSFVIAKFDYLRSMACFFAFSVLCFITTCLICFSMKERKDVSPAKTSSKEDYIAVFKNKYTYILLLPNVTRGIAAGIVNVIAVVALSSAVLDEQSTSYVNIIIQITAFLGNLLFAASCKKIPATNILWVAAICGSLALPFCLEFGLIGFVIIFFVAYFFRNLIDTAIPIIISEIIPREQIGAYTSIRMLLFTGAQAVAALLVTPILNLIGAFGLLAFAAVMQLTCGVIYCISAQRCKKEALQLSAQEGK